jgi:hypothetical protein
MWAPLQVCIRSCAFGGKVHAHIENAADSGNVAKIHHATVTAQEQIHCLHSGDPTCVHHEILRGK